VRRAIVRAFALGIATGSFLTSGIVLLTSPAKADPISQGERVVCVLLDQNPTFAGIVQTAIVIEAKTGVDDRTAGQMIAQSVYAQCPEYIPLITAFANKYAGGNTSSTASGKVGGKVA